MDKFQRCLDVLIDHEGRKYTNDPNDRGGPTKFGIALNEDTEALTRLLGRKPTAEDIMNLTEDQAGWIFKEYYWNPLRLDEVKDGKICLVIFDMGVLIGIGRSAKLAQAVCDVDRDGDFGPITLIAINHEYEGFFCRDFLNACESRFRAIVANNSSQHKFLAGWLNRVDDLRQRIGVSEV